ncbi:hypothetical protein CALCODRAFT_496934 [Calocera cornea HHB12733]|uniref:Phytanoyl-CoA dioxygenase family protein n=1 Tax=Calocera cornea HHB12733 TaxID=1353952 RepID=A0A165FI62_9BASI|nr:hypothetical protein CALCODRAFT_496934 [Calocera cornea HHB12733]
MIEDAVDHAHLDALNERMTRDAWALWEGGFRKGPQETGNIQIDPPVEPELFFEDAFLNRLAICVTTAYLGGKPRMTFNSGNAAMHGTASQSTHSDFGNFGRVPAAPFAVVVNTGLVRMSPANGSTELWLGTHLLPRSTPESDARVVVGPQAANTIRAEALDARRRATPAKGPFQPTVPKGALMIRDLRLWHGGRPNPTHEPRIMLAQIHFAPGYNNPMKVRMPEALREVVQRREDVDVAVEWVSGRVDNLRTTTEHTFNFLEEEKGPAPYREMERGKWAEVGA